MSATVLNTLGGEEEQKKKQAQEYELEACTTPEAAVLAGAHQALPRTAVVTHPRGRSRVALPLTELPGEGEGRRRRGNAREEVRCRAVWETWRRRPSCRRSTA